VIGNCALYARFREDCAACAPPCVDASSRGVLLYVHPHALYVHPKELCCMCNILRENELIQEMVHEMT
jgi:hypothetical protein